MFFDGFFDNLDGMVALDDAPVEIFKLYVPDVAGFFGAKSSLCVKPSPSLLTCL